MATIGKINVNMAYPAEPLEKILLRAMTTNEPIGLDAPITYTEAEDGVLPQFDIRTDRWDIAMDVKDKFDKADIAKAGNVPKTGTPEEQKGATATGEE